MEICGDSIKFGDDAWVYCKQHLNPHCTGWCTVSLEEKVLLDAKSYEEAIAECKAKGFVLYNPTYKVESK